MTERDLAHEADIDALRRQLLRDDINPDEAGEYMAQMESRAEWMQGADLDDEQWGGPDEFDDHDVRCERCFDDGMDPLNDYLLPFPTCQ
jgi:hypothetical protein